MVESRLFSTIAVSLFHLQWIWREQDRQGQNHKVVAWFSYSYSYKSLSGTIIIAMYVTFMIKFDIHTCKERRSFNLITKLMKLGCS